MKQNTLLLIKYLLFVVLCVQYKNIEESPDDIVVAGKCHVKEGNVLHKATIIDIGKFNQLYLGNLKPTTHYIMYIAFR